MYANVQDGDDDDDGDDDNDDDDDDDGADDGDGEDDDDDDEDDDDDDDDEDENAEDEVEKEKVEDDDVEKEEEDDVEKEKDDDVEEEKCEEDDDKSDNVAEEEVEDYDVWVRWGGGWWCWGWWCQGRVGFDVDVEEEEQDDIEEEKREPPLCVSFGGRNAHEHIKTNIRRAIWYGNLAEKCRGPDGAKNADTHFARACAVETHVSILQAMAEEPLYTEIETKNTATQMEPRTRHTLCASLRNRNAPQYFLQNAGIHFAQTCAIEMHISISQETSKEALFIEIYR